MLDFSLFLQIPYSTFFIIALAVALSTTTSLVQRKFVNFEELRKVRNEMNAIRKEMFDARKKGDKKAYAKLQKKQSQTMADSAKVMGQQTKVSLTTTLPFLALFWILYQVFSNVVVATSPIPIPYGTIGGTNLLFWMWYMFASFAVSLPINRALKVQMY